MEPGLIVVKFKNDMALAKGAALTGIAALDKLNAKHQVYAIDQALPFLQFSEGRTARELQKVYYFKYAGGENPVEVAIEFDENPHVEYAEPYYLARLHDTPNDPQIENQGHIFIINLLEAWDIIKGDSGEVVIATVDGGADWQHEDLNANIWNNEDEIADNGIDDDGNGFIDDVRGWNFSTDTNDPKARTSQPSVGQHGTHVSGIAAAVTNNDIGVAGVSWNCKIMPVNVASKSANNDSTLGSTYEGVAYAANNGADVISLSWGGRFRQNFAEEIIELAYEKGSLIVCSAGNDRTNIDDIHQYPPNYDHVLAVGSTTSSDRKSGFSNFGVTVDVYAPGEFVLSTFLDGNYGRISGTSMSAPMTAGVAGLVKTLHPDWSVDQVREQVRVTAKEIESTNSASLSGLLGKGRIDALQAVTATGSPAVRVVNAEYIEPGGDGNIDPEEVIDLVVRFTNYLEDASGISVSLTAKDSMVSITSGNSTIASLSQNDTTDITFQFATLNSLEDGKILKFIVDISTASYTDRDYFEIVANPAQVLAHNTGTLVTSITSQGNIGYVWFADNSPGDGFTFNGTNMLFEGGLMIGAGPGSVSDCIRGGQSSEQDDDFRPVSVLNVVSPGELADQEGSVVLNDDFAAAPLGLRITQSSFTYTDEPFNDFVIIQYVIKNDGTNTLSNLHAGLFFDWDINADAIDNARFDASRNMGYAQNTPDNPNLIAATRLLTPSAGISYRSIHNPNDIFGEPFGDGFTGADKWNFLRNGIQTTSIDTADVSTLVSAGPFSIEPDQSVEVAFAVIAAASAVDLIANADAAQFLWDNGLNPEPDLTPPATVTSVLQNPAASKYADVVVVSDRPLLEPPNVSLWVNTDTTSLSMGLIPGAQTAYSGGIEFTASGTYSIRTTATGLINSVDSTQLRSFEVAQVMPGNAKIFASGDGVAELYIGAQSISSPVYFLSDYDKSQNEAIYHFGPERDFDEPLQIVLSFDPNDYPDINKLFIYRKELGDWLRLESRVSASESKIKAETGRLGKFKLVYDGEFVGTNLIPTSYALRQNYPNPFNPTTVIEYDIPEDGDVKLTVFNILGQAVKVLHQGRLLAGSYQIVWDSTNEQGRLVPAGVYIYHLQAGRFSSTRKMILLQ
jgi:hypothetical protein